MGPMSRTAADSQEPLGAAQDDLGTDRKSYLIGRLFAGGSETNGKASCRWRAVLPLVMLLAGVSTVFLFSGDRDYFYRQSWVSSHQFAVASNLSPASNFMQFDFKILDSFGNLNYNLYGRFPLGSYVLIRLVTFAFDNNMSVQIYVARILMLVFFVGTVMLAYWSLCRLTSNRWVALSATALAFSSGYFLYYNDMISTEFGIDLFGCMLVFHGMTIFALEGRFRQLVVKSCIALLLGWHVLAVLMPFVVLGLSKKFFFTGPVSVRDHGGIFKYCLTKIRVGVAAVVTSRYIVLGIIVVGFSLLVLVSNIGSQYYHHNIENDFDTELSDLPVLQSATARLGGTASSRIYLERLEWLPFLRDQFIKIGLMSIPFALPGYSSAPSWWEGGGIVFGSELQSLSIGIVVVGVCIVGGIFARYRLLTMTAAISGFCWAVPWRYNVAGHQWESLYYVGLPLVLFAMIFTLVRKLSNELFVGLSSVITVLIFGFSSFQMSSVRDDRGISADLHRTLVDDFNAIRRLTGNSSVLIPTRSEEEFTGIPEALRYYLSGSILVYNRSGCNTVNIDYEYNMDFVPDEVDFIIQTRRDMPGLLTPNNRIRYLYNNYVFEREITGFIEDNEPLYSSAGWDIYLTGDGLLLYIADRCGISGRLLDSRFFLEIIPVSVDDLPAHRRPYGYDRFDFYFDEHEVLDTKRFILALRLPDYDIARIRAGQFTDDEDLIWEGTLLDQRPDPG